MADSRQTRWLHTDETESILDFIYRHPGVKARVIAKSLMLPKRSVNGFLYAQGANRGVKIGEDYRWWPGHVNVSSDEITEEQYVEEIEARYSDFSSSTTSEVTSDPRDESQQMQNLVTNSSDSQFSSNACGSQGSAPEPEWTDNQEPDQQLEPLSRHINSLPARKQSGWSLMGFLYLSLFGVALALFYKAAYG